MDRIIRKCDIIGKIKRASICQKKHLYLKIWKKCSPSMFWAHPKLISRLWFASQKGYFPNLSHPRDFNELLIKLNLDSMRLPLIRNKRILCADKFSVRDYISSIGLSGILNKIYGVYNHFEDIHFDDLPNQFVLKMTTGCGQNIICTDKSDLDVNTVEKSFRKWYDQASTFGLSTGEWHYSLIKPRIIAEEYLNSIGENTSIIDYKFHCIKGKVVGILVCYDRDNEKKQANFDLYDICWHLTDGIFPQFHKKRRSIPKPSSLEQMIDIAQKISYGFDYVRVDLYEINGKPVFGEMTFTPAGNVMTKYQPWVMKKMLNIYYGMEDNI